MIRQLTDPERDQDRIYNFFMDKGQFRGAILKGTAMVREMQANHNLGILETLILGHAYMAAGLLTTNLKGGDRLGFEIKCDGPVGGIYAEGDYNGHIRGYLKNDHIPLESPLESFDTAPFIGGGTLSVTKVLSDKAKPFTGTVELVSGTLAKDLAYYFTTSEQIPTAFDLSIFFDKEGKVAAAGALLIQSMPGTPKERLEEITQALTDRISLSKTMASGKEVANILFEDFGEFSPQLIGNRPVEFSCPCDAPRFETFLKGLSQEDKKDIKEKGPFPLVLTCHHCGTEYTFSKEKLETIL